MVYKFILIKLYILKNDFNKFYSLIYLCVISFIKIIEYDYLYELFDKIFVD